MAIDTVNAAGGVQGRAVRLLERDDEGKAERAIAAAEELIARQGVVGLLGGYVDSLVGPVSEVAERARVPYLAAASLDERLTARGHRYFFRVSSLRPYVTATVGVIRDLARVRRVAILHSTTPGATQLAAHQRQGFEAAGSRSSSSSRSRQGSRTSFRSCAACAMGRRRSSCRTPSSPTTCSRCVS